MVAPGSNDEVRNALTNPFRMSLRCEKTDLGISTCPVAQTKVKSSSCWILLDPCEPDCFECESPRLYNLKSIRQLRIGCPEEENTVFVCYVRYGQAADFLGRHTRIRRHPAGLCTFFAPTMVLPWWVGIDNGESFLCHTTQAMRLSTVQQRLLRSCNGAGREVFRLIES
jgi:hypothetical protein